MQNEKMLVGWFFECLACKATFIRTTPENWTVGERGKIFRNDTKESTAENAEKELKLKNSATSASSAVKQFVGFVRCPDCLSQNVRLMEIGDRK